MKKIINIIQDDIYTVLEFEDHSILPLMSVEQFFNFVIMADSKITLEKKCCIFCRRDDAKLVTLDKMNYLCLDCTTKLMELFSQSGSPINLNLGNINPEAGKILMDFLSGNIDKASFQINDNGIKIKADELNKKTEVLEKREKK